MARPDDADDGPAGRPSALADALLPTRRRAGLFLLVFVVFAATAPLAVQSPWTSLSLHLPYLLFHLDVLPLSSGDLLTTADMAAIVVFFVLEVAYLWLWAAGLDALWTRAGAA